VDFTCPAPSLWFTDDLVGKVSAMSQPTRPTQLSIFVRLANEVIRVFAGIMDVETIKEQTIATCGCMPKSGTMSLD